MDNGHDNEVKTNGGSAASAPASPSTNTPSTEARSANVQSASTPSSSAAPSANPAPQTANPNPNVAFRSDAIGQWAAKQDDPFAEQNRRAAAKKAAQAEARKKALPYVKIGAIVAGCLAALAAIIVLILVLTHDPDKDYTPEIAGSSEADITAYQDLLQQFYDRKKGDSEIENSGDTVIGTGTVIEPNPNDKNLLDSVDKVVQNTLDTFNGQDNTDAVLCAQAFFYYNNGYYQEAIDTANRVNLNNLDNNTKSNVYEALANSYYLLGDTENANAYYDLLMAMPAPEGSIGG